MARFDRYMLSQLMVLFGFFALVLVSIYWINQAVRLFDRLVGDGQSAWVFLEFTALTLPNVIRLVLPIAAFAAAVYVTNRLSSESELTVVQATGYSPWRLARPVLVFGIIVGLMMAVLTHFLVPASKYQLQLREAEIAQNITSKLLTEGTFLHPSKGVTFYIREITAEGALEDVFLSDRRNPDRALTYTADQAYLVRDEGGTKMVMVNGLVQSYDHTSARLFTTHFADFSYDLGRLIKANSINFSAPALQSTLRLATEIEQVSDLSGWPIARILEELHGRFNQPLLCIAAALIGFATLLTGTYSRFGVWRQIVAALTLLIMIKFVEGMATDPVRANADLWWMIYLPSAFGLSVSAALLAWAGRNRRRPRRTYIDSEGAT